MNDVEWGQNDLIQCCLLIGDSTGLNHSDLISTHPSSFQSSSDKEGQILGMASKWQNGGRMTGMRRDGCVLRLSPQPKTVEIGASFWSRAQNRGLWLVERTLKKYLRGLPWFENVRHSPVIPTFWHHSVIEEKLNDKGMTNQVDPPASLLYREWHWNDRMTIEWQIK